jgi:hypothetical protein
MSLPRKLFITLFIVFNFLIMFRVHLPLDSKYFSTLYRPIDSYLSFFSIYQDWFMFAPNPSKLNLYITAEVEFDDGSKDIYEFERNSMGSLSQKYISGERYRKFTSESLRKDKNSYLWKDAAKFALRKLKNKSFSKIPLKVHLTRHWDEIPNMEKEFRPHLSKSTNYQSFKFYTYEVL